MTETPDQVHGRLNEAMHIADYAFDRAWEKFEWLLEEDRWKQVGSGHEDVNAFLSTVQLPKGASAEQRKTVAAKIKALQPEASQRRIAGVLGVGQATVGRDLRPEPNDSPPAQDPKRDAPPEELFEPNGSPTPDGPPEPEVQPQEDPPVEPEEFWEEDEEEDEEDGGNDLAVHYSSDSGEWYTPGHIIKAVVQAIGEIDLDPCSNAGTPIVPARTHFTYLDDGLAREWSGAVYMNPPYGRGIGEWTEKLRASFEAGDVTCAVALLPSRTDTAWMFALREYPKCFLRGRISFSGHANAAPFPSCAVYFGAEPERFARAFDGLGDTYVLLRR